MAAPTFNNNKFVGKIGDKRASDYYSQAKLIKTNTLEDEINKVKEILGIEEIDEVQFPDEFWTKIFLQNDENEYVGGIKLILNKTDTIYSDSNIAQTLEKMGTDILKKDKKKEEQEKIKVYHSLELFNKAEEEYHEWKKLTDKSVECRNALENGWDSNITIEDLRKSLIIDTKENKINEVKELGEIPVLANLMNYKLEKKIDKLKDYELEELNELYKLKYPVVDMYYQAYVNTKKRYRELTQNPKELWKDIADPIKKKRARFKKLNNEEKKLKKSLNRQIHKLREDFIDCIYAKVRFIMLKAPLKDNGYPSWEEYDEKDESHVRFALLLPRTNDLQTDTGCIVYDLDKTIELCDFTENQRKILELYRKGTTQEGIASILDMKQPNINKSINAIIKKVVDKNWELYEDYYCLNIVKADYKRCSQCGEIKIVQKFNKNGNRLRSQCKQCQKK